MKFFLFTFSLFVWQVATAQQQVFTSGLFLKEKQWEAKIYNNLYTQFEPYAAPKTNKRGTYFSSFIQTNFGTKWGVNLGFDLIYKSNISNDLGSNSPLRVFNFERQILRQRPTGDDFYTESNHGLSHVGIRARFKPFKSERLTFQQAFYAPLRSDLDQNWVSATDIFFEYNFSKWAIFVDAGNWLQFGKNGETPFRYAKIFLGSLVSKKIGPFLMLNLPYEIGGGVKFFARRGIELEAMYTRWLPVKRIVENRQPETFNFGFRFSNF